MSNEDMDVINSEAVGVGQHSKDEGFLARAGASYLTVTAFERSVRPMQVCHQVGMFRQHHSVCDSPSSDGTARRHVTTEGWRSRHF